MGRSWRKDPHRRQILWDGPETIELESALVVPFARCLFSAASRCKSLAFWHNTDSRRDCCKIMQLEVCVCCAIIAVVLLTAPLKFALQLIIIGLCVELSLHKTRLLSRRDDASNANVAAWLSWAQTLFTKCHFARANSKGNNMIFKMLESWIWCILHAKIMPNHAKSIGVRNQMAFCYPIVFKRVGLCVCARGQSACVCCAVAAIVHIVKVPLCLLVFYLWAPFN